MDLLERDHDLGALAAALDAAAAGRGRIALIGGEAGIGKTSLLERFIALRGGGARVLRAHCDPLFTPTPLGPLYDLARLLGGRLQAQVDASAARAALFSALFDQLRASAQPTLLAIEDLHWADEATLDMVKFLGRRVGDARIMLAVTFREDEIGPRHPLRLLLGDMASSRAVLRLSLARLSVDAVRALAAGRPVDAALLHRRTAGNPFFVSEVLSTAVPGIPDTVRDAVLARAARLGPAGRRAIEAAAVAGGRIDPGFLARVAGPDGEGGLGDCLAVGIIELAGDGVAFRHELAREAVLAGIEPALRRALNRRAMEALLQAGGRQRGDLAQLVQYAEGAGDAASVREFGLAAARAAAAVGAHREATAQFARVLAHSGDRPPAERAALCESYAEECSIIDDLERSSAARSDAIAWWRQAGNRLKEGENLAQRAWPLVRLGRNAEAEESCRQAIDVLAAMPASRELAAAYRIRAHLRMLDRDRTQAVRWGRKAIALAKRLDDGATIAGAEMVVGSAMLVAGDDRGRAHLDRCIELARQAGLDSMIGLAYVNIGSSYGEQYRFAEAEATLVEGMAYARERDLDHSTHYMIAWMALLRLFQGRWAEAADLAGPVLDLANLSTVSRIMALVALGRVRTRRGDPGAGAVLDEALALASQTGTLQRLAPVRAARAEAAWLAGDGPRAIAEAADVEALARQYRHRWHAGEFAFWRRAAGERATAPSWAARPYVLQINGQWRRAADAWKELGCPYEQARALAEGDPAAQTEALEIFDRLGATPAAAALRRHMRGSGVRRVPRGPRATTRRNPFGLTAREMEVLACLAAGLSNGRIGTRLHVSPKTVDHHVSAVLAKLGAASRGEAARLAREQGLLPQNGEVGAAR